MKKLKYLLLILVLSFSFAAYAQDDEMDALLMEDDAVLEQELLGGMEKSGDIMSGLVKQLVGQAVIKEDEQEVWKQVFMGMDINEGSTIVTMEESQVKVELENGAIVDIRPRTQAYFETLRKDPLKEELTETGIQLFMGKIYSNVKKLVDTGSRYEVNTGTATAGVRGTQFISEKKETGEEECTVIEGNVDFYKNSEPDNFVKLGAGKKAVLDKDGKIKQEDHKEKAPEDVKKEEVKEPVKQVEPVEEESKKEVKETTKEEKKSESMKGEKTKGSSNVTMETGYKEIDGQGYAQLEINPDFENIFGTPIGLGLKFSLQQGQDSNGDTITKYGAAAEDEFYKILSIRWAEFNTELFGVRYGELGGTSYGHGLLMDGYDTFGLKLRISPKTTRIKAMIPLKEAAGSDADKLVAGRIEQRIYGKLYGGATYVTDMEDGLDEDQMPTTAMAGDLFYEFSKLLTPYAEYASLTDFGSGFSTGLKGAKGIFNYKIEYRNIGDEFIPGYYDNFYETNKTKINLKGLEAYSGYVAGFGLDLKIARLDGKYEMYEDSETVSGEFVVPQMKFMPGMWSRLQAGVTYKQKGLDTDFIENAEYNAYFMYPASQSVDIKIEQIKDPGKQAYQSFRTIVRF